MDDWERERQEWLQYLMENKYPIDTRLVLLGNDGRPWEVTVIGWALWKFGYPTMLNYVLACRCGGDSEVAYLDNDSMKSQYLYTIATGQLSRYNGLNETYMACRALVPI